MLEERTQDLMVSMSGFLPLIVTNALNVLGAIVILLIGLWLSGKVDLLVVRMLSRAPHFDAMLKLTLRRACCSIAAQPTTPSRSSSRSPPLRMRPPQ